MTLESFFDGIDPFRTMLYDLASSQLQWAGLSVKVSGQSWPGLLDKHGEGRKKKLSGPKNQDLRQTDFPKSLPNSVNFSVSNSVSSGLP
jgi:hypothetical protein